MFLLYSVYCTQSDILLCGIARFSWGNKSELRTFQPQKGKKIKNSRPQTKFTGSYKKKRVYCNKDCKNENKRKKKEIKYQLS